MSSTFSTNLAIELIGTGDQAGVWGNTTNTNLGTLIEQAISGYVTQAVSTGTDTTITIPNGATGVARNMYIELTGTGGASTNLIVPSNKKLYFIFNNTSSGQVTVKVSGQTGVSVPNKAKMVLVSNGTDIVDATNYVGNLSAASANITVLTSASATITNLLATSLTVSSGSTLNGGVVINEPGADADFRVEGDTDANLIFADASTDRVGVGTNAPGSKLDVAGTINSNNTITGTKFVPTGNVTTGNGMYLPASNVLGFSTGGTERLRIDANGNIGFNTTASAWGGNYRAIQGYYGVSLAFDGGFVVGRLVSNTYNDNTNWLSTIANNGAARFEFGDFAGTGGASFRWLLAPGVGSAGSALTFTQAMTLDASGNLGVGTTSPSNKLDVRVASSTNGYGLSYEGTVNSEWYASSSTAFIGTSSNHPFFFRTNNTERARITSAGEFLVGKTVEGFDTVGARIRASGNIFATVSDDPCFGVNRKVSDGTLVQFCQDDTVEGTISVSSTTVSYNAFAGSHWSQLQDGSKPDILRGTVMESINELCVWPGEQNERLPKSKISDTAGSKKVYGVFMAWDNDWTTTNDMYVTAVGAFICRVNGSVTVQEGDLLESNGDGTARVQADDIIRSSTIGKVTSTVKTHEYADGSYCVPTVLYCG